MKFQKDSADSQLPFLNQLRGSYSCRRFYKGQVKTFFYIYLALAAGSLNSVYWRGNPICKILQHIKLSCALCIYYIYRTHTATNLIYACRYNSLASKFWISQEIVIWTNLSGFYFCKLLRGRRYFCVLLPLSSLWTWLRLISQSATRTTATTTAILHSYIQ